MLNKGKVLADIGTDHAFLPILAIKNKKVFKAYACDVAEGPLEAAGKHIAAEGLADRIKTVLSNGFQNVPLDADVAVIAGMGFYTAKDILEAAGKRLDDFRQIIVEVNRKPELLRAWISAHHYTIEAEELITERLFDYVAISFSTCFHDAYQPTDILCGPILQQKKNAEYPAYCNRQIDRIDQILAKYPHEDKYKNELILQKSYWLQAKR